MISVFENEKQRAIKRNGLFAPMLLGAFGIFGLTACSGGGGSSISPPPPLPPANLAPNAVIETSVTTGLAALDVSFSAKSSTDNDGTIASYAWDFTSDGNVDAMSADAAFTYTAPGVFTATLTVTDNEGATDRATVSIQVDRQPEKIAFIGTEAPFTADLFLINDDGSNRVQLSQTAASPGSRVRAFKWSPDGQWLAYQNQPNINQSNLDLMVISVDGGSPTRVSAVGTDNDQSVGSDFTWSPDSTQIAFTLQTGGTANTVREVYLVDRNGANPTRISGGIGSNPSVGVVAPRWSANGEFIFQVVERLSSGAGEGINVFDVTLGSANSNRLVTNSVGVDGLQPGPVGATICYSFPPFLGAQQIRTSNASTGMFPPLHPTGLQPP